MGYGRVVYRRHPLAAKQEGNMKKWITYPRKYIVDVAFLVTVLTVLYIVISI